MKVLLGFNWKIEAKALAQMAISEVKKRKKKRYLPSEVVTDIFARLPIRTLGNVILVNKFCLKLISSPAFARAHLKYSKQGKATTNLSDCKIISFPCSSSGLEAKQFSLASLLFNSSSINAIHLDFPKYGLRSPDVDFVGSCDGLVCLVLYDYDNEYVLLWNPCTGKYKKLPHLHFHQDDKERSRGTTYGLCYDESTDDFKVVAFCAQYYKSFPKDYEVYVFSLKRNSWKRIRHDLKCNLPEGSGKLLSGKLHWLSGERSSNKDDTRKIVSFHVESEVFGIVEPPSRFKDRTCDAITLDVLEECICLLISYKSGRYVDLWVLKEYGVKESWTKVVTISCVHIPYCYSFRAGVLQNDEILFHDWDSFAVYNPKEGSFRFPGVRRLDFFAHRWIFYVPSLVSPVV